MWVFIFLIREQTSSCTVLYWKICNLSTGNLKTAFIRLLVLHKKSWIILRCSYMYIYPVDYFPRPLPIFESYRWTETLAHVLFKVKSHTRTRNKIWTVPLQFFLEMPSHSKEYWEMKCPTLDSVDNELSHSRKCWQMSCPTQGSDMKWANPF